MSKYNKLLVDTYFDKTSPYGFASKKKLLSGAQIKNKNIRPHHVDEFFASYVVPGRYRLSKKKFPRRVFVTGYANSTWGADLANMQNYWPNKNAGFKHLLVVTDIFSRDDTSTHHIFLRTHIFFQ